VALGSSGETHPGSTPGVRILSFWDVRTNFGDQKLYRAPSYNRQRGASSSRALRSILSMS
jgi:hypothetical protein